MYLLNDLIYRDLASDQVLKRFTPAPGDPALRRMVTAATVAAVARVPGSTSWSGSGAAPWSGPLPSTPTAASTSCCSIGPATCWWSARTSEDQPFASTARLVIVADPGTFIAGLNW